MPSAIAPSRPPCLICRERRRLRSCLNREKCLRQVPIIHQQVSNQGRTADFVVASSCMTNSGVIGKWTAAFRHRARPQLMEQLRCPRKSYVWPDSRVEPLGQNLYTGYSRTSLPVLYTRPSERCTALQGPLRVRHTRVLEMSGHCGGRGNTARRICPNFRTGRPSGGLTVIANRDASGRPRRGPPVQQPMHSGRPASGQTVTG